jgi:U3 small nucleolar RNA-associated protein 20
MCNKDSVSPFIDCGFIFHCSTDDPVAMVDKILNTMDLEHVIPPKRLQSSLNLLSVILDKFGRLMGQRLLPYLLKILFCISAIVQGTLASRDMIHPGYLPLILALRNSCQGIAAGFFEHFDNYVWSEGEVDVIFQTLVWPWLEKLPVEGIHSPTSLLKLFLVWSKHPR